MSTSSSLLFLKPISTQKKMGCVAKKSSVFKKRNLIKSERFRIIPTGSKNGSLNPSLHRPTFESRMGL